MIKITFIIPHQEIEAKVHALLAEVHEEGIVFNTMHIVGTQESFLSECDSDIIIARGITYLALKQNLHNIAVIEIAVTGYDIIRALNECKRQYNVGRIAIITAESITYEQGSLDGVLGVEIVVYKIVNEQDILQALQSAKRRGLDAVVGGLTACQIAQAHGWPCIHIRTGEEAIRRAVHEALSAACAARLERAKAELFKVILEHTKEAVVAIDQNGVITAFNKAAYKALNIPPSRQTTGRLIDSVLPGEDVFRTLETLDAEHSVLRTVNGRLILAEWVPIRVAEKTVGIVYTLQNVEKIQETESIIRKELSQRGHVAKYSFGNIIGSSEALQTTIHTAYKYSQANASILLLGETGTGKELFAQSIHNASSRSREPFVAVNCAAVPENLLESELFGYVEGAFSGAAKNGKTGLFEYAHKGTIFLDEISEIPLNLQAKLLRVLQEREIRKVGDTKLVPVDVRVIAATNTNLHEKVQNGQFRQDLLYRLDVLSLRIPPLRERGEDIQCIAKYYIEVYSRQYGKTALKMEPAALRALNRYQWPGNVRQVRNICERLVVLSDGIVITENEAHNALVTAAPPAAQTSGTGGALSRENLAEDDYAVLIQLIKTMKMNKADMAAMLGLSRTTLWRKLKQSSASSDGEL